MRIIFHKLVNDLSEGIIIMKRAIVLNPKDNVATALADLKLKEMLVLKCDRRTIKIELNSPVPFGHKFSLEYIESGSQIIKYGEVIGKATKDIEPGDYIHIHNVVSTRGRGDLDGGVK